MGLGLRISSFGGLRCHFHPSILGFQILTVVFFFQVFFFPIANPTPLFF